MTTTLRILKGALQGYYDIDSRVPIPRKNDHVVFKQESFIVNYVEFDYDTSTVFVIVS